MELEPPTGFPLLAFQKPHLAFQVLKKKNRSNYQRSGKYYLPYSYEDPPKQLRYFLVEILFRIIVSVFYSAMFFPNASFILIFQN